MARREGTLKLSSNIELRAAAPLDARTIVPTLAELTASGTFSYPYVGMIVSVQSEGKAYMLTAEDPTVSTNWIAVGSGSGDTIQVEELPEPTEEQNGKIYQYIGETTTDYTEGYFYTPTNKTIASNVLVESKAELNRLFPSAYFTVESSGTGTIITTTWTPKSGYVATLIARRGVSLTTYEGFKRIEYTTGNSTFTLINKNDAIATLEFDVNYCNSDITGWSRVDVQPQSTFNEDDFNVVNNEVSLTPEQRIFSGTKSSWDIVQNKTNYRVCVLTDG